MERHLIPTRADQPTNRFYDPSGPRGTSPSATGRKTTPADRAERADGV